MTQPITRTIELTAQPSAVYRALTDAGIFSKATGAPAQIDGTSGGEFSLFGGIITGRNIELVPDRLIVQAWRVKFWPEGEYSVVRFDLSAGGGGTHLRFNHKGFPDEMRSHLNGEQPEGGWDRQYFDPLRQHFAK